MAKKSAVKTETSPARIIFGLVLGMFVVLFAVNWAVNHQPASKDKPEVAKTPAAPSPASGGSSVPASSQTSAQRSQSQSSNSSQPSNSSMDDSPLMLAVDTSIAVSPLKSPQSTNSSGSAPAAKPDPVLAHYLDKGLSVEQLNRRIEGVEDNAAVGDEVSPLMFSTAKMTERITFNFTTSSRRIYARLPIERVSEPHVLVEVVSGFSRQVAIMSLSAADQAHVVSLHQLPKTLGVGNHQVRVFALTDDAPLLAQGELIIER